MSVDDENGDDADFNNEMQQEESTVQEGQESNKDDPLNYNGVKWSVVSNVSEDTRAMILWDNNTEEEKRTILDYFKLISYADHR